jgi:HNH endonuclease
MRAPVNAADLGQRLVAVLETGLRTATYKLATLMGLVEHCVEHYPSEPSVELRVPIDDLAERVIALYWRQVEPLAGYGELRQSTQARARIPAAVKQLRGEAERHRIGSAAAAKERLPDQYERAVNEVALTLAQQPLHRLQRAAEQEKGDPFLFDDSWLHDGVTSTSIAAHGGAIRLFPGVAHGLAHIGPLLRPSLEHLWVQDVTRMNRALREDGSPDLLAHLFGQGRVSLERVREALFDEYGARCFYCDAFLRPGSPVDHVLPWSRVGINGLANLVTACLRCNASKSRSLAALPLVDHALSRDPQVLCGLADDLGWPVEFERTVRAASGLYRSTPLGTPTWVPRGPPQRLDLVSPPTWLSVELSAEPAHTPGR